MYEFSYLGPTPGDEECTQIDGSWERKVASRNECQRYVNGIRKYFGNEPKGCQVKVKTEQHDFGTYYEAVIFLDEGNDEARKYAITVDNYVPGTWGELENGNFDWKKEEDIK